MQDTKEQTDIIFNDSNQLAIIAFAGCGKTSTLVRLAEEHPMQRMLYVAYNRAIRDEALRKFPKNVECKTSHQLAFRAFGVVLKHKLTNNLRLRDIAKHTRLGWADCSEIRSALLEFMYNTDAEISRDLFMSNGMTYDKLGDKEKAKVDGLYDTCKAIWRCMTDPAHHFPAVHDTYLKLYQLSKPQLKGYDAILFDEAQDANPVTTDIVLNQKARIVLVGDPHQQIYRFRGADDALNSPLLNNATRLYLSQSFRVGNNIAEVANRLLAAKGESHSFYGNGTDGEVLNFHERGLVGKKTVIHRTVAGAIETASKSRGAVCWVGGIDAYPFDDLLDIYYLKIDALNLIKNRKLFNEFKNYEEYKRAAEESGDNEMGRNIALLHRHSRIDVLLNGLKDHSVEDESLAETVVTTAHRCKGLEWDAVEIANDFSDPANREKCATYKDSIDEVNLLYVAITRAKKILKLSHVAFHATHNPELSIYLRPAEKKAIPKSDTKKPVGAA